MVAVELRLLSFVEITPMLLHLIVFVVGEQGRFRLFEGKHICSILLLFFFQLFLGADGQLPVRLWVGAR